MQSISKLSQRDKHPIDISPPQLVSTAVSVNIQHRPRQGTPVPGEKHLVAYYNAQADKAVIRSLT